MQKEIWKEIPGYHGRYLISNLGNVKSTDKLIYNKGSNCNYLLKGKILKGSSSDGYMKVSICKGKNNSRPTLIHQLVAITFLNHKPCKYKRVIDHIDGNILNNHVDNLQIITNRENISKGFKNKKCTSKFTGVYWHKSLKRWRSIIKINGKRKYLGMFKNEYDAHLAYQNALKSIKPN